MAAPLLEAGVMFAAVATASLVAGRLGVSPIPFYVVAGTALGESVLGRFGLPFVADTTFVKVGAELGIVFLLLFLGLEFDVDRLLSDRGRIGRAGLIDLGLNFGVGFGLGVVLFGGVVPAILTAGIVYMSSSAIVTKTLLDLGWIANPESGPILGTLVFEDLVIAVYLAVVTAAVLGGGPAGAAVRSLGLALAVLAALGLFAYLGTRFLERLLDTASGEYFVLRAVGTTVLLAGGALAAGVSEAVAAFLVGTALAATSFAHEVEETLSPLRNTFAAVFFFRIGLLVDPPALVAVLDLVAVAAAVSIPTKLLGGFLGGRTYGLDDRRSLRVGLALVTRGEFSLIVAAAALTAAADVLDPELAGTLYAFTVGYVLLTAVVGTTLMGASGVFERYL